MLSGEDKAEKKEEKNKRYKVKSWMVLARRLGSNTSEGGSGEDVFSVLSVTELGT